MPSKNTNWVTPDLARTPALAADANNSKQPIVVAPILGLANKTVAVKDAINDHSEENGTQSFWAKVGAKTLDTLEILAKPLQEVQRDYRFTHAVYTDHGFMQGFAVTLGIIGGGVGGALLGGPGGAVLGAEASAFGLRKLSRVPLWKDTYNDSYSKSEDPNYKVSPGRDFTNAASKAFAAAGAESWAKALKKTDVKTGDVGPVEFKLSSAGSVISGVGDLTFDIVADPFMVLGRYAQLMKAGKLVKLDKAGTVELKYPIMNTVPGVKDFIISRTRAALTPKQMDAVRLGNPLINSATRTYNRALDDIANSVKEAKNSGEAAGNIAAKYPQLGTAAAGRIAVEGLDSADKVHEFLKTSLYFGELEGSLAGQAIIPTRTLLRATLGSVLVADKAAQIVENNLSKIPGVTPEMAKSAANGTANLAALPNKAVEYLRNSKALPGKIYKTFSGYMPYSVDPETQKLSLTKFRWNAPDAALNIYRIARIGMGDRAARIMAGKYAEAVAVNDLALARGIKNQTLFDTFKALGLPDNDVLVKNVYDEINQINTPLVGTQIYGVDVAGNALGQYTTSFGPKTGGLVFHHAQDSFDIPDYFAIKKSMRDAGLHNKFVGGLDEFVAKHYTNKIFKPLALATMGFGLRVAAAEMIPTFARFGIINTFKAKLAASAAKANYDLIPKEASNVFSAAMTALGLHMGIGPDVFQAGYPAFQEARRRGLSFAAKMLPEEQMDLATRLVLVQNGHTISEAVSTGHGYDADVSYQMGQSAHYYFQIQKNGPLYRDLPEYTMYSPSDIHFPVRYADNLNKAAKELTNRNIAKDLLDEVAAGKGYIPKKGEITKPSPGILSTEFHTTEEFQALREVLINKEYARMLDAVKGTYKGYEKEMQVLTRWVDSISNGTLRVYAQDRVDSTLGLLFGKNGTFHEEFARDIVSGSTVDFDKIVAMTRTSPNSMPAAVSGPMLQPYVPAKGLLVKITNLGFKKVIDPIVNGLAREPLYLMHVADAYARMAPRIAKGWLTEDQALRIAQTQGSLSMLPQIHNTALRNQFAQLARNFLPFYFAQEQALRRAFNALKDTSIASPLFSRGMRFYQITEHALSDPTFIQEDDNGNKYMYFPGVGAFGEALQNNLAAFGFPIVAGLPISAKGSLVSLKSVLPELQTPGVSPVMAVSLNWIPDLFPETKDIVQGTVGNISYQRGILDSLIPASWAKTLLASVSDIKKGVSFDLTGQLANATSAALAAAYYHNQVPSEDSSAAEKEAFIDRMKNNARSILLIKTFLNLTSPLAPQVSQEDAGFRDEFWNLVKKNNNNFGDALMEFLGNHGTRAVSYTVAKTESNAVGAKYPYIQSTVDFIKENHDKFFTPVGKNKETVSQAYFFLIPQDNVKNESDRTVYNELLNMHLRSNKTYVNLLNSFYIAQGDSIMSDKIREHIARLEEYKYDPFLKQQENKAWSEQMKKMQNLHPTWYESYTSGAARKEAQTVYNQLVKVFSDPNPPQHKQAKLVQGLMKDYQAHQATMSQFKALNLQGIASTSETQNWENYLYKLSIDKPELKSVIDSVFRKLG